MSMATLISKFNKKDDSKPPFHVGQRVRLSSIGRGSLLVMPHHSPVGTISNSMASYPDSISVLRDGSKTPLAYHKSYWEPV
jgi:hypothetical protein